MKSLAVKFAAVFLAALSLLTTIFSGMGIVVVSTWETDAANVEQIWEREFRSYARDYAYGEARHWATTSKSTAPQEAVEALADHYLPGVSFDLLAAGVALHSYTLRINGEVVASGGTDAPADAKCWTYSFTDITPTYTQVHDQKIGTPLPDESELLRTATFDGQVYNVYACRDLIFQADVVLYRTGSFTLWSVLESVWQSRNALPFVLGGSMLLLAVCMVYLCWVAGKQPGTEEIRPGGLNRLPLDLYAVTDCLLGYLCLMLLVEGVPSLLYDALPRLAVMVAVTGSFALSLLIVSYVFCFAAQVKAKGFWWRRSVVGWCCIRIFRALRFCMRGIKAVFRLLPVMWQWLLTAAVMVLALCICAIPAFFANSYIRTEPIFVLIFLAVVLCCVMVILYGGYCFGTILKGARQMARGDLTRKINTRYLYGPFRECGENLNSLSAAAMASARQQMKSERMKTELITNVSHDIKTPLTSIINYVDLLLKPHTPEQETQYLQVLSRQSQRLKKLTEDLVELSKATTGNLSVELTTLDAAETVLQALGEFGDKLEAVPLSVVFRQPEQPVFVQADGRLTWRVISNLLSNTVKYAQSGTRLYVDIVTDGALVGISFKNISRESLNISADELMGRFVRGDTSRNTEGSGLGLSIAAGLMQSQGGSLELTVDGDLFKVMLIFPRA